ncbi:cytokinin riboside 5'-monophosphate phosphoribohydrolase LOG3-like [Primulina eburnea]|uniref:cytokinin riboside 5'-monophosphate phosphoribohydrolase LOG3-like n=1 Tax=Primulina eburnea TaxID=1245227 RepID=UPI003C6CA54D
MIEFMCNGTFEDKNPNEAMEYLDSLAENAQNWNNIGKDSIYEEVAEKLGITLAKKNIHLVYGGGEVGLIRKVAKTAHAGGIEVLGIIPITLANLTGPTIGEKMKVDNMYERITQMIEHSDAFIVLPGGFGTLEEIFHTVFLLSAMANQIPAHILNAMAINFESALSVEEVDVKNVFLKLESAGLRIFLGQYSQEIYPNELQDLY